jgi:hypothetical protein
MMTLDDGLIITFGQNLKETEERCSYAATASPFGGRKGSAKVINLKHVSLTFDCNLLCLVKFDHPYQFKNPLTLYPERWKNLTAVAKKKLQAEMLRNEFLDYLTAWEQRARQFGAEKKEICDLAEGQYHIFSRRDKFVDMISISLGPTRKTKAGGIWSDGWIAMFDIKPATAGRLRSVSALRDAFNTAARRRQPSQG